MVIPYDGFAGESGIDLNLVCLANRERLALATARTNTTVVENFVRVPKGWCTGEVVLDASSTSTSKYIEVGTPFQISAVDYYKNSFIGLLGLFALTFCFTLGLLMAPDALCALRDRTPVPRFVGFVLIGAIGYVMFFVYFYSYLAGRVLSALIFIGELGLFASLLIHRRSSLEKIWARWKLRAAAWAIAALAVFCLTLAFNNGAGSWTVNAIFTPARWSSDNQFPMIISEYLFHGIDPRTLDLGPWKISDRPPLAYGLMAALRIWSWIIASHQDGYALYYQFQQLIGVVINTLWVVVVYEALAAINLGKRPAVWLLIVVAMTPFAIFNSAYIWPKMLGAAFGLLAFLSLLEPERNLTRARFERFDATLLWAAVLSGLALMSHGGTAFGVVASILVAVQYRGLPARKHALGAIAVGLAVLTPWVLWQHLEQPPGNALIKFAFTGNFGFGHEKQGLFAAIREAYSSLSFPSWVSMKLHALRVLILGAGSTCGVQEIGPISSFDGRLRARDFFYFIPSLRFLALGFVPLLFLHRTYPKVSRVHPTIRFARILVSTGLLSIGLYALAGFHCYINHMQSYQAVIEVILGLALALHVAAKWYWDLALAFSVVYGLVIWVIDPLTEAPGVYVLPILALGVLAVLIYRWFTRSLDTADS